MAISKKLQETIEQTLELSGEMLEQAGLLRQKVDLIESEKDAAELQNKLVRIKIRENWANAEVRYYRALQDNKWCAASFYDIKGQIFTKDLPPTLYKGGYKPNIPPNCRHPEDWVCLWSLVAEKLRKYRKNLVLQQFYGRNPKNVAMFSPKVIVNED